MLATKELLFLFFIDIPFFMDFSDNFIEWSSQWRELGADVTRPPHGFMRVTVRIGTSNFPTRTRNLSLE